MELNNIQMVDLHSQYLNIKSEVDNAIFSVIKNSAFINGEPVKKFSKELATYNSIKNAVPCGNGTDALQIALMTLGLQQGAEVLLPAFTYVATAEVIALLKLTPVFVEVNPETFNIDIQDLMNKITEKSKVIIPVHLYGQCADMESVLSIASENDLYVIEDAAQSIGAEYTFSNGVKKMAGTMGDIGCLSFFPSKNLGCFGDGGAMLINDDALAEKAWMIANHGQKVKYHHEIVGCNSRLDTIQAAVLSVKLKYLDTYIEKRRKVAEKYDRGFVSHKHIETPNTAENCFHVYNQYTVKLRGINRNDFQQKLKSKGVPTMVYYPIPLHLQKAYKSDRFIKGSLPVSEKLSEVVLSLPIHTEMIKEHQSFIIKTILESIN